MSRATRYTRLVTDSRRSRWCAPPQLVQILSVESPEIPFVLVSGYAVPELKAMGIVAPCGMLAKPLVEDVFLAEMKRCLRQPN
jgi:hypothetical protein